MYWLFSKEHEKIALLKETSAECITSTLSSGDKELYFEYRKDGRHWKDIECEGYILTPDDEFVIKDIETGDTSDKYTCALNIEELEAKTFEGGFESVFATFEQCMKVALEGTGWELEGCDDIQKRRTIRRDAGASAKDVIDQCITTYKIEIKYNTLRKTISAYEHIGSDRGRYFMESLNLRQLNVGRNTYDFCTELLPIGKDGLTIEKVNGGSKYISDYSYCSKKKRKVWIDRRYTHADALMEDAAYKLEEMAKPYTTYEASVVDLAAQSEEYKNVLDYSLGDTMTIVSKKEKTLEKQRIVKTKEYPRTPEKNTCELSSTRKTFAEVQRQESEDASDAASEIVDAAAAEVNKYADRLFEKLSDDVEEIRKTAKSLQDAMKNIDTSEEIGNMNKNISDISEAVQTLLTTATNHEDRIKAMETVIDEVKTQSDGVEQLQQGVAEIRSSILQMTESMSSMKTLIEAQGQKIEDINAKIAELHPEEPGEE